MFFFNFLIKIWIIIKGVNKVENTIVNVIILTLDFVFRISRPT